MTTAVYHPLFLRAQRLVEGMAGMLAILSGILLIIAILLTTVSIVGRLMTSLGLSAIPGDYELVQIFCGLAVFSFMPYCQLRRGHVSVDLFISPFGAKAKVWTQLLGDMVVTGLFCLLAWRHFDGTVDKFDYQETTFILQIPVWWAFAGAMVLFCPIVVTGLFTLWRDIVDIIRGDQADTEEEDYS
ncbi:TRAP transporter small permease [Gynuella sp.]|uniref:TRAP transporter small permease n=1 Tax=Gynuella sp. TaxID=2969146 RepID=UPI003D0B311E